jgi:hypothetical protein
MLQKKYSAKSGEIHKLFELNEELYKHGKIQTEGGNSTIE